MDKEDIELINKIKNTQCNESLKEIINRHAALCFNIYNKYSRVLKTNGELIDNIGSEKDYIIYKSVLSYDPTRKTKFSTWLGNFTKYYCLNLINSKKKYVPMEDDILNSIREKEAPLPNVKEGKEIQEFVTNLLNRMKDKRIKKVFTLRYATNFDKKNTWVEIGKRMKVSPQTAMNLHDRGKRIIAKKLVSNNFADSL